MPLQETWKKNCQHRWDLNLSTRYHSYVPSLPHCRSSAVQTGIPAATAKKRIIVFIENLKRQTLLQSCWGRGWWASRSPPWPCRRRDCKKRGAVKKARKETQKGWLGRRSLHAFRGGLHVVAAKGLVVDELDWKMSIWLIQQMRTLVLHLELSQNYTKYHQTVSKVLSAHLPSRNSPQRQEEEGEDEVGRDHHDGAATDRTRCRSCCRGGSRGENDDGGGRRPEIAAGKGQVNLWELNGWFRVVD